MKKVKKMKWLYPLLFTSIGITGCYKPLINISPGQYYEEDQWYTSEMNLFENGTYHSINTVYDVGGYRSTYGLYDTAHSKLRFENNTKVFFEKHLELNKLADERDSIILSFQAFIPYGFEFEFDVIYSLTVKGKNTKGDTIDLHQFYDGHYPMRYEDIHLNIAKSKIIDVECMWIEREGYKLGLDLTENQIKNVDQIKYPVIFDWLNYVSDNPYKPKGEIYWEGQVKGDRYLFKEYTDNIIIPNDDLRASEGTSLLFSMGATLSYKSILGPIDFNTTWINDSNKLRFFLSVGIPFNREP